MNYRFYGWEHANVPAITNQYKGMHTPLDLYDALSEIWCADTCAPRMREKLTAGICSREMICGSGL